MPEKNRQSQRKAVWKEQAFGIALWTMVVLGWLRVLAISAGSEIVHSLAFAAAVIVAYSLVITLWVWSRVRRYARARIRRCQEYVQPLETAVQ